LLAGWDRQDVILGSGDAELNISSIAVIGAGSWGTALSSTLASSGHRVRLWANERDVVEEILTKRENSIFLPGIRLPENIVASQDLPFTLDNADFVVTVMPSHVCRRLYEEMLPHLDPDMIFVSATKGIDNERLMRMSEVIQSVVKTRFVPRLTALSGPSFAREVATGDPTAIVVASEDACAAQSVQEAFSSRSLRIYTSNDMVGVELGGAIKNVIAIAAGVIEGLGLGHNPKAALITRGLAEITRLACACGARSETLSGLAGMGDLVLTCTGDLSRNRSVGAELGKGRQLRQILENMRSVAEGVNTTDATIALAERYGVEMPITRQVYRILQGQVSPMEAIGELMERTLTVEF
jgi:glycerol-3-phosphate dehydrogenase (NAD(P)+)